MLIKNEYLVWSSYKNFIGASILTMIASQAAETCDAMIVGYFIGPEALSGVNSCMPLFQILEAVKYLIGFGAGIRIAKLIGENSRKDVNLTYTLSIISIFVVGLLLTLAILFGLSPLSHFLSNDPIISANASKYLSVYAFCVIPTVLSTTLGYYVQTDGNPKLVTKIVLAGSFLNLLLDYLFVAIFDWGIEGSAYATFIAFTLNCIALYKYGILKNDTYRFRWVGSKVWKTLKEILMEGIPSTFGNILLAIMLFAVNTIILGFLGRQGMNIWSICLQVLMLFAVILSGVCNSIYSVGGMLVGEKDYEGLRSLHHRILWSILACMIAFVCFVEIFPGGLVHLFGADESMMADGAANALRVFILTLPAYAVVSVRQGFCVILEYRVTSMILSVMLLVVFILSVTVMTFFPKNYFWWGIPVSFNVMALLLFVVQYFLSLKESGISPVSLIPTHTNAQSIEFSVEYTEQGLAEMLDSVNSYLETLPISSQQAMQCNLLIEELGTNIYKFAHKGKSKQCYDLHVSYADDKLTVILKDDGKPFNPMKYDLTSDAEEHIGMRIIQNIEGNIDYKYMYGQNIIMAII
jgi:Na+-driven multidrug efflux pump/anti-sigma regulatory factor (Ser/Thr protein kinase)